MPPRHHRALAEHGSSYLIDVPMLGEGTLVDPAYRLDAAEVFGRSAPLVVEIGSGGGDCVVHAAQEHPELDFLAVEVWRPGVAQTIAKAVHEDVRNIRLMCADAAQALPAMLGDGSVRELWTFFPDPWPKTKHHKRRLVQPEFADKVANLLKPQGVWRLATDWADYAWQIRDVVEECPALRNPHAGRLADPGDPAVDPRGDHGGFAPRFDGRVLTRFERKGLRVGRVVRDVEAIAR
ncbi:tRNA (guanosine(46)-N7)-methyltransferase TrmB [Flexivirga meconopsidis]|uniref:tRNA (guanosine(46)-N7)-methyltransferase TrmB n=1 Tax=Flexivirga meconopsidis TaxID=2977121 RepID=UPI00223FC311|nr:tRNA (guanosine(46)-N7)-methyltransferase TrmB [Flexivirga meconopsidis]